MGIGFVAGIEGFSIMPHIGGHTRITHMASFFRLGVSQVGVREAGIEPAAHPAGDLAVVLEFRVQWADQTQGGGAFGFAHLESRTLIEIAGGIFMRGGGRHTRGAGYAKDAEMYLKAVLADWTVIRLTERQLDLDFIERIVALPRQSSSSAETASGQIPRTE